MTPIRRNLSPSLCWRLCKRRLPAIIFVIMCLQGLAPIFHLSMAIDRDQNMIANNATTSGTDVTREVMKERKEVHPTFDRSDKPSSSTTCGESHHVVYDQIRVAAANTTTIQTTKILCFVMTHSNSHDTRVKAIQATWGKRCDKMVIASNLTDPNLGTIAMQSNASYLGLWEKLNETMQYVWDHYRNDGYDWVYKADDDTFLVMENLKSFLSSRAVVKKKDSNQLLIYGRRYSSPRYRDLAKRDVYFKSPVNADFGKRFYNKINKHKPVLYNYGGPGYAMNWPYVEKFLEVMKGPDTVHGTPPEDQAHGVVMAYHDVWPQKTRDALGREQFHPESAEFMYSMEDKYKKLWNDNHKSTGGVSVGPECCSENSIAFHHIRPPAMYNIEQILYDCR